MGDPVAQSVYHLLRLISVLGLNPTSGHLLHIIPSLAPVFPCLSLLCLSIKQKYQKKKEEICYIGRSMRAYNALIIFQYTIPRKDRVIEPDILNTA